MIEAAPEKLELKRDIFKQLDCHLRSGNTLAIEYLVIQRHRYRCEHAASGASFGFALFQSPAIDGVGRSDSGRPHQRGDHRKSHRVDARGWVRLRRAPRTHPGFIVNRIARPFYNEGLRILGDGDASVETIDRIMKEARQFPHGSLRAHGLDRQRHQLRRHRIALPVVFRRSAISSEPDSTAHGDGRQTWAAKPGGVSTVMTKSSLAVIGKNRLAEDLRRLGQRKRSGDHPAQ